MMSCCLFLSMLVCELDTAPYDGTTEPLGEDRSLRAHPPLHRVAEHQHELLSLSGHWTTGLLTFCVKIGPFVGYEFQV
jgi:hypothetical protein